MAVAVTPVDRNLCTAFKLSALVALRRTEEGAMLLEAYRRRCVADGLIEQLNSTDTIFGVCKILQGNIRDGLRLIEEAILRREKEGYRAMADWSRLNLAEIYLQIIAGNEKPPLTDLIKEPPNSCEGNGDRSFAHSRSAEARPGESTFRSCRASYWPRTNDFGPILQGQEKACPRASASD